MGVSHTYLTRTEVQKLLGVTTFGMWRLTRKYDKFPKPDKRPYSPFNRNRQEPEEAWDATEVYSWAAQTAEFVHRGAPSCCAPRPRTRLRAAGSDTGTPCEGRAWTGTPTSA
ncbi:hypothetical protein [Streptomyces sp. NBC_00893]|uniref:hypothetical protein n=1 Tax=Streptomyces sp. NBC_00893 TaxID=2975862 RepID=UPI002252EF3E|nr:hypothetical protein [Streptomyces sp. NBC_00893]MCX4850416.1 hypothetical protein [Streptomyces sp. NBC_00893]